MSILNSICQLWLKQLEHCRKHKYEKFGRTASRAWDFLGKNYKELYIDGATGRDAGFKAANEPYHKIRLNKSREFVSLMLPSIHHKVPHRLVSPRRPPIPPEIQSMMAGQMIPSGMPVPLNPRELQDKFVSWLMQWFLNYLPGEYNLRKEGRLVIPEGLVKGRGVVWHEMVPGPSGMIPASHYDSVDHLFIDPDAEQLRDCGYIIRQRRQSIWRIADEFQIPVEELRGRYKSHLKRASEEAAGREPHKDEDEGESDEPDDVAVWYEVWSRVGLGHRFSSSESEFSDALALQAESLGENVWLAIMPGVPYPLNIPSIMLEGDVGTTEAEIKSRIEWPVPFHVERAHPWPFSQLDFLPNARDPWAASLLEGALPLQEFIDRCYSFLMDRIKQTSRSIMVVSKELQKEVADAIVSGVDLELTFEDDGTRRVRDMIDVVSFPDVSDAFYAVLNMATSEFERATGMTALMYGAQDGPGMRSSAEAQIKQSAVGARPDDYAECVEDWMSCIARAEGFMSRLYVSPHVVAPLFGEDTQQVPGVETPMFGPFSQAWGALVNTKDPHKAAAEFTYTIEAGTGRRPNKAAQTQNAEFIMNTLAQPLLGFAQGTGNPIPFNSLVRFMGETYDMRLDDMMLPPPQPQLGPPGAAPPGAQPQGPPPQGPPPQ